MNILSKTRDEVVALVKDKFLREESIKHWDICAALKAGKTIETVAEDFKMNTRSIDYIKQQKCYACR